MLVVNLTDTAGEMKPSLMEELPSLIILWACWEGNFLLSIDVGGSNTLFYCCADGPELYKEGS